MTDVPEDAIRPAAEVLFRQHKREHPETHLTWHDFADPAREVLEAAAPAMAEHVAQKITAHKYAHEPKGPLIGGKTHEDRRRRAWRRHFSIAARVAANAFYTDEDMKRLAAEAIARGDVIACDIPEVPREVREDGDGA